MRTISGVVVAALCIALNVQAANAATDLTFPNVALRPGVTVNMSVTVHTRPRCVGATLIAVHGLAHTATTYENFVAELFSRHHGLSHICRVVAVDLPGHGKSGLPTGITFGELLLDDYVTATLGTLDRLKERHIFGQAIVGHSMGGVVVQMTQARLVAQDSSLARRYGLFVGILLNSVMPAETPWAFAESGQAAAILSQFVTVDPVKGAVARIPAVVWPSLFFSTLTGTLPPGTPTPDEAVARGYINDEALFAGLQLIGAPPFSRPSVPAGTFALCHGTALVQGAFTQDVFSTPSEQEQLYRHLTGDSHLLGFATVNSADAVHDMYIANPAGLIDGIAQMLIDHLD